MASTKFWSLPRRLFFASFVLLLIVYSTPSEATPITDALSYISSLPDKTASVRTLMNGLYPISWNASSSSQLLIFFRTEKITPVLWGSDGTLLGALGTELVNGTRFSAFSVNPQEALAPSSVTTLHARTIAWLLGDSNLATSQARSLNVTISFGNGGLTSNTGFFKTVFPNWTVKACHNTFYLTDCLHGADLHFIFGSQYLFPTNSTVAKNIFADRLTGGTPISYIHDNGWQGDNTGVSSILGLAPFPYAGIWFNPAAQSISIPDSNAVNTFVTSKFMFGDWKNFLTKIRDDSFTFNISNCTDDPCPSNTAFGTEVWTPIGTMRSTIKDYENSGISPLGDPGSRLLDMMVKVGDYLRSQISYPLKRTSSKLRWASYLAADALYVQLRSSGSAQPDLGDFNKPLNSSVPRLTSVNMNFPTKNREVTRSFTYSAAAGDTVTITRTDRNANLVAYVFINMIRPNTYAIRNGKYKRPMWLYGNSIPIKTGQTIKLNSAYGGIIFCYIPASETTDVSQTLSFTLSNVVQHPVYRFGSGQSVSAFTSTASQLVHGWIELVHPYVEVHERWAGVLGTLGRFGDFNKQLALFEKYIFQYHYALAGFRADNLTTLSSVASRAASFGLRGQDYTGKQHELLRVQHINSDKGYSKCGTGCAGDPIDIKWAFSSEGWGEHHEMGHNIQYNRFNMNGEASREVSNNIFPLSVNWKRANVDRDLTYNEGTKRDVAGKLTLLQQAATENKTATDVGVTPACLEFYTTLITSGRERWEDDGFQIIPQLYLMSRNIDAISNWTAERDNFGYSLYNSEPSRDNGNDFMVMAFSWINKLDYRPFFWVWGATWSPSADAQIAAYRFDPVPTDFAVYSNNFIFSHNITIHNPRNPYANHTGSGSTICFSYFAVLLSVLLFLL